MSAERIYCVGPFASPEDSWQLLKLDVRLRAGGYRTYISSRDGLDALYPGWPGSDEKTRRKLARSIFAFNVFRLIRDCRVVVFSMNGRVPDENGLIISALAYMTGIPVILYKQDHRSVFHGHDNAMVTGLSRRFSTADSPDAVLKALAREISRKDALTQEFQLPPAMSEAVSFGRRLAEMLAGQLPLAPGAEIETARNILAVYDDSGWAALQMQAPEPAEESEDKPPRKATGRGGMIYCSGPLFCRGEVNAMANIARALESAGWDTYLPHRDGVEAFVMKQTNGSLSNLVPPLVRFFHRRVFAVDVYYILKSDCLVFNLNGRVPDEGGVAEIGMAFAAGKPVILYREVAQTAWLGEIHPMITGTGALTAPAGSIAQIVGQAARIDMTPYRPEDLTGVPDTLSPCLRRVVRRGRRWSKIMNRLSFFKPKSFF